VPQHAPDRGPHLTLTATPTPTLTLTPTLSTTLSPTLTPTLTSTLTPNPNPNPDPDQVQEDEKTVAYCKAEYEKVAAVVDAEMARAHPPRAAP